MLNQTRVRNMSVVSYLELVQGARDKHDVRMIRAYVLALQFHVLPLTESIGYRASIYMETHALGTSMGVADALIAATAAENELDLCTANVKHYRAIKDIRLVPFRAH